MDLISIWVETGDEFPVFFRGEVLLVFDDDDFVGPDCFFEVLDVAGRDGVEV
jgi:hypothetical protein